MTRRGSIYTATRAGVAVAALAMVAACSHPEPPRAAILVADPPVGSTSSEESSSRTELERGIAYIKNEKYDEAKVHLQLAMAGKATAEAAYYMGLACEKLSDRPGAEAAYKKALEIDPRFGEAAGNLSALYLDDPARPDQAIALLEVALKETPDDIHLRQNLALAYGLEGNVDAASKQYDAVLAKGEKAEIRFAYGAMLVEAKQPEKAAVQLRKALDGTTDDPPTLVTIGRMLAQVKAYPDCVKAFDRAIKLKATDPEWFVRRGTCRHELKDEAGAQADYEGAIKADPKFAPAYYYMGLSFRELHKPNTAITWLEKAVKFGGETGIGKAAKEQIAELAKKK